MTRRFHFSESTDGFSSTVASYLLQLGSTITFGSPGLSDTDRTRLAAACLDPEPAPCETTADTRMPQNRWVKDSPSGNEGLATVEQVVSFP